MKHLNNLFLIALIILFSSCRWSRTNQSITVSDSYNTYSFEAEYPTYKTEKLEAYLDKTLKNDIPLDQHVDMRIPLNSKESFNLTASDGHLKMTFEKTNSTAEGYMKMKRLGEGLSQALSDK